MQARGRLKLGRVAGIFHQPGPGASRAWSRDAAVRTAKPRAFARHRLTSRGPWRCRRGVLLLFSPLAARLSPEIPVRAPRAPARESHLTALLLCPPEVRLTQSLVIVESPAKARTLGRYLGKGYTVVASVGHVRDLPKHELGIDVERGFEPNYQLMPAKRKVIGEIRAAAGHADRILLATDPDREGEAIGWHLAELLRESGKPIERVMFHEITKRGVTEAIANPRPLDQNLVDAQQARRVLDRLVGYTLSPLLWDKIKRGLSAGRVQSVALKMICDREAEIEAFIPEEYWHLDARLAAAAPPPFVARLAQRDGKKLHRPRRRHRRDGARRARRRALRRRQGRAPAPAAEVAAAVRHRQAAAGRLPALPLPGAARRCSSRRSSTRASTSGRRARRVDHLHAHRLGARRRRGARRGPRADRRRSYGPSFLPEKPNYFKNRSEAQDAHEAIRPTDVARTPEAMARYLAADELKLYTLIWQRFVASQMTPAQFDVTDVLVERRPLRLQGEGRGRGRPRLPARLPRGRGRDAGRQAAVRAGGRGADGEAPAAARGGAGAAPRRAVGERRSSPSRRRASPSRRWSRRSRRTASAGRRRTRRSSRRCRSATTSTATRARSSRPSSASWSRERSPGRSPTSSTRSTPRRWRSSSTPSPRARWSGAASLRSFWGVFTADLAKAKVEMTAVKREGVETKEVCPTLRHADGAALRQATASTSPASDYPTCKTTREPSASVEEAAPPCPECGAEMVHKRSRFGPFWACSRYPACKGVQQIVTGKTSPNTPSGVACPECGDGELVEKRSRRGPLVLGVQPLPEVQASPSLPSRSPAPCPTCGYPFVLERTSVKKGTTWACPREGCDYKTGRGESEAVVRGPWIVARTRRRDGSAEPPIHEPTVTVSCRRQTRCQRGCGL